VRLERAAAMNSNAVACPSPGEMYVELARSSPARRVVRKDQPTHPQPGAIEAENDEL
jgi:hypothetical protein